MPQYMLLLHGDPSHWGTLSPEDMLKGIDKYMGWAKKPFFVSGKRLRDDEPGRVIRSGQGQPRISDGPYSETKEVLGGYYLIEAANYDEAVQRSLDHPQLEYGGTIEVRELYPM